MERKVDPGAWRRVLVRMPNWVGDVVMATPALRAIREASPQASITVALKEYVAPLLGGSPYVDAVVALGDGEERGVRGAWRLSRRLKSGRFDAAVLLTNSLTSAIPVCMARIPVRLGYAGDGRGFLLTHSVAPDLVGRQRRPMPMPEYYQRMLDRVGIPGAGPEYVCPPNESERAEMRALLDSLGRDRARPLVGLNPGARFGSSKLWPPERFGELAATLSLRGLQPLLLCGPGEEELAQAVRSAAGNDLLDTSTNPVGLAPLRALLEMVDLLVTTDSGPRHLAVVANKPVVVLMGPTWPQWTDWNLERTAVLRHDVPCGPCHKKVCPVDHACMDLITVEEVVSAVDGLLAASSTDPRS
ncbi:MAG: lipopolysaccharide heptosyltransferase II [Planctomycetes bacterium]|nr:lipopolysaccharide heptosyltransferase II [Planctomycetota bacterium]